MFVCIACGSPSPREERTCRICDCEATLMPRKESEPAPPEEEPRALVERAPRAVLLADLPREDVDRLPTGIELLDAAMGGGAAVPSVILLAGAPGAGKTTLGLRWAAAAASVARPALVGSSEQPAPLVAHTADRAKVDRRKLSLVVSVEWSDVRKEARRLSPPFVLLDSLSRFAAGGAHPGSPAAVGTVLREAVGLARELSAVVLAICHETRAGDITGGSGSEYDGDATLYLEPGGKLRVRKHRYGPAGLFPLVPPKKPRGKKPAPALHLVKGLPAALRRALLLPLRRPLLRRATLRRGVRPHVSTGFGGASSPSSRSRTMNSALSHPRTFFGCRTAPG